jgi:N-acetylneuraminic acid mutarotase
MPANNINNIAVTCGPAVTLGGSVSGLTMAGLTLSDGTDSLQVPSGATSFQFPTPVVVGSTYTVKATTQPNGLTCTISGATGTVPATNVTSVQVTCAVTVYTLGGTITGLTQGGLILANGSDQQPVAAGATTFTLPTGVAPGATYTVSVLQQPVGMKCTLTHYTGTMPAANVSNVQVACAQRMWTWMNGSNTAGALGVYSGTETPGARDSVMTWKDGSGNFWLFGGAGTDSSANSGGFNDLWEYSPGTHLWTYISGSQTVNASGSATNPSGRQAGMVWKDSSGNIWLFGGLGYDTGSATSGVLLCDMWKLDMATRMWSLVSACTHGNYDTLGAFTAANWPPVRSAASTWTDGSGRLWMFGGQAGGAEYNDVWVFDPAQSKWAWMGGASTTNDPGHYGTRGSGATNNIPSARYGVATWQDAGGKVWLFGGAQVDAATPSGQDFFNDLWVFDPASGNWTWLAGSNGVPAAAAAAGTYGTLETPATNNYPGARAGAATWADGSGNLWMSGGFGYDSSTSQYYLNDLWLYNPTSQQWAWVGGSSTNSGSGTAGVYGTLGTPAAGNQPGGRFAASGWTDSSGNFWLFGGLGLDGAGSPAGDLNDLWVY